MTSIHAKKEYFGIALLAVWLVGTGLGFWWFETRHLRLFAQPETVSALPPQSEVTARLEAMVATATKAKGASGRLATLVHFADPACSCNEASANHVRDLWRQYTGDGLALIVATQPSADSPSIESDTAVAAELFNDIWPLVPSVPAAALFDGHGRLIYFGPYSSGPSCGSGINFVDDRLARLRKGEDITPWVNSVAFGCFCDIPPLTVSHLKNGARPKDGHSHS